MPSKDWGSLSYQLHYLLLEPILNKKLVRWFILFENFDIVCVTPSAIKEYVVIHMITAFSANQETYLLQEHLGDFLDENCFA